MSESAIRAKIKTILETASGIGRVYGYQRSIHHEKVVLSDLVSGGILNAWSISRDSTEEIKVILGLGASLGQSLIYQYEIEGYYALKDSTNTEGTFSDTIASIASVFRAKPNLDGVCFRHNYIRVQEISQATLCDVLCHYTKLILEVEERT